MTELQKVGRTSARCPARWRVQAHEWLERPRPERDRRAELIVRAARMAATALVVGLAALIVLQPRSSVLAFHTDIMGYAVANGFSPGPYEKAFVGTIALVLFALVVHAALGVVPWFRSGSRSLAVELGADLERADLGALHPARAGMRTGLVAFPLTVEAALVAGVTGAQFVALVALVPVAVGITVAILLLNRPAAMRAVAPACVAGGLVAVAGLSVVAARTWITTTDGRRAINWFPWWLSLLLIVAAAGVLWLRHRGRPIDPSRLTGDILLGVVGPVVLVLFVARLTGILGHVDLFHDGEGLVPATQMRAGALPWRDFLSIHGLLQDVGWSIPGLLWLEDSRWGAFAGQHLWLLPIYWLAQYVLAVWLFRGRRWVIALFVVIVAAGPVLLGGSLAAYQFRMLLQPVILVAFGAVLARATWGRAALLAGLVVVDLVVTPESALVLVPIAVLLVLHALEGWWRNGTADWSAVIRTGVCGVVGSAIFGVYLVATGSVSGVVDWVTTFAVDHTLTGARPIAWALGTRFTVEVWLTAAIPLAMIVYAVVRRRTTGRLRDRDWVMLAAAVGSLGYYPKFIARPDFHIEHVWPLVIPVAMYLAVEAVDALDRLVRRAATKSVDHPGHRWVRPFALLAVVAVFAPSVVDIGHRWGEGAERFRPIVGPTVDVQRMGYFNGDGDLTQHVVDRIDRAVTAAGGRTHGFFDFTNSPGLFHYVLGIPSVSPFFDIAMAIPVDTQRQVISDLERASPEVVAWSAPESFVGLPSWDGVPNQVRHYLVAEWILDRYVPYVKVAGYGIWVRRSARSSLPDPSTLDPDPDTDEIDTQTPECDWGRAARYLDQVPTASSRRSPKDLALEPASGVVVQGWAIAPGAAATRVIAVADGRTLAETRPSVWRPDIVLAKGGRSEKSPYAHSGFEMFIDRTDVDLRHMQVVAVDARGRGTVLAGSPGADLPAPVIDGVSIVDGALKGSVDSYPSIEGDGVHLYRARLDAENAASYNWIGFDGDASAPVDVEISADPGDARREIGATVMPGSPTTQYLRVGACSQWLSVDGWLYLVVHGDYRIGSVRLFR